MDLAFKNSSFMTEVSSATQQPRDWRTESLPVPPFSWSVLHEDFSGSCEYGKKVRKASDGREVSRSFVCWFGCCFNSSTASCSAAPVANSQCWPQVYSARKAQSVHPQASPIYLHNTAVGREVLLALKKKIN